MKRIGTAFVLASLATVAPAMSRAGAAPEAAAKPATAPAPPAPAPLPFAIKPLTTAGPFGSTLRFELYERVRGEFVNWFETSPTGPAPNSNYDFLGNKLQLGLRVTRDPYEMFVQVQNSTLAGLPDNGVGIGSTYFANTMDETQNAVFLRNAWVGAKRLFGVQGLSVKAGRQLYVDALDVPATHPTLKWVQASRLAQRLIGPFDYTHVGRSFDGGQLAFDTELVNVTGFGFVPTYGGFEVDANRELDVVIGGLALNLKESTRFGPTIARLFWYYYDDDRDVLFVDNRPVAAREADRGRPADIHTIGLHVVRAQPIGPGTADGLAYAFGQLGDWQSQDHRAWAYGLEAGYRLANVWAKPWLRGGINAASGDDDPTDGDHDTFFQLLPTPWLYAQFPFYNMMNNQDVFTQLVVDPHPMATLKLDFHWLRLESDDDVAYFGGGATKDDFFGYGGVSSGGASGLAHLVHTMLTLRPTAFLTVNVLYAHAFGRGVIDNAFLEDDADYAFVEGVVAF